MAGQAGRALHRLERRGICRSALGSASDDAGNKPHRGPKDSQVLSLATVMEVLVSRLHGRGLPLGCGAALKVYRGA